MSILLGLRKNTKGDRMSKTELTKGEAYAVAEFIDMNIFTAIRSDEEWDSFQNLRNLCHAYEKCCAFSGYVGVTDSAEGGQDNGLD